MEDALIFNERATIAGFETAVNETQETATLSVKIGYDDSTTYSFSNSLSIMTGVNSAITTGLPRIAEGKIKVSTRVNKEFEWNKMTTETRRVEGTFTTVVPPRTKVSVTFIATQETCNVPFSYTQCDWRSGDGRFVTSQHVDGVYTGVNYYSFHFQEHEIEPL